MRPKTIALRKRNTIYKNSNTQLYVFKLHSGIYKIGCSDNIEARLKQGKTWSPHIELIINRRIPAQKSFNWRQYESKIHKEFDNDRCKNGGTEMFHFTQQRLNEVVNYIKHMRF
jgi:hypothetical protein